MSYNLVIVESAAKAKTIEKYLNNISELSELGNFKVIACFGHIKDLPKKELGINEDTWNVTYELLDKRDVLKRLKSCASEAKKVFIASDLDLEGNAIAFHLREFLKLKRKDYERITFNEITKKALKEAVLKGGDINMCEVYAQETRRILDRLVGYKMSPLLWSRFNNNFLSAGRVQSVALKIIMDRKNKVENHEYSSFWECHGNFQWKVELKGSLYKNNEFLKILSKTEVDRVLKEVTAIHEFDIQFKNKDSIRNPSPPFTTSSLQQEIYTRFKYTPKQTMSIAQELYEGGFITYMRTDSVNLSKDGTNAILKYIKETIGLGEEYAKYRTFTNKNENAQEAHEAIRPTKIDMTPEVFSQNAKSRQHINIYESIWKRTIASQMTSAVYLQIDYNIYSSLLPSLIFIGQIMVLKQLGYLKIMKPDEIIDNDKLNYWNQNGNENTTKCKPISYEFISEINSPKPLYDEASIIKKLEKEGIGRPSTYVSILEKLYNKHYITKGSLEEKKIESENYKWSSKNKNVAISKNVHKINSKADKKMISTELGESVTAYIQSTFPELLDSKFTADIENNLDNISQNKIQKNKVLDSFYKPFKEMLNKATKANGAASGAANGAASGAASGAANGAASGAANGAASGAANGADNTIKDFPNIKNIKYITTRYGAALFDPNLKKYHSVAPFLKWKKISDSDLSEEDAKFILSLPIKLNDKIEVHIGQYGLYIKNNGKNEKMAYKLWDKAYNGTLQVADLVSTTD